MIKEVKTFTVVVGVGDLYNYKDRIHEEVEKLKNTPTSNGVIFGIESYKYEQLPFGFATVEPRIMFKVECTYVCRKYFPRDIILLEVKSKGKIITASNNFFSGTTLSSDTLALLDVGNIAVFIINNINNFNNVMIGNVSLYQPNPIVYRVRFDGDRSERFIELIDDARKLADSIKDKPHFNEVVDHLFIDIGGQKIDDFVGNEIYLHFNSRQPISLFSSVDVPSIEEIKLTRDSDHTLAEIIRNRLICIENILDNFTIYSTTMDRLKDRFDSIKNITDEI